MFGFKNGTEQTTKKGYVELLASNPILFWNKKVPDSQLEKFKRIIEQKYDKHFENYWDLHKWTVDNYTDFWKEVWHFFDVVASQPYNKVLKKTGNGFLDNEWFSGATLNFAENLLRIRDDSLALIVSDELGNEETVTFAMMFEEVRRYAAAFRKHGLKVGDRVGCIMSNRKEALFAMLAATSIGAIWSGPLTMLGPRATTNILQIMEPKFLIAVDHVQDWGEHFPQIDKLIHAVSNVPSIQKVIVVVTKNETEVRLSDIKNSISLEDFLESGKNPDDTTPTLRFEQLPFDHPVAINFTSGTTGTPKGVVHSAGTFIAVLRDFGIHQNLKRGDRIYTYCPVGWSVWDNPLPSLAIGCTLLLFDGNPEYKEVNVWNILSKYEITFLCLTPATVDILEKDNIVADPKLSFDSLRMFNMGASPVKRSNYEFVIKNFRKDIYLGYNYGATEVFGSFSGYDINSPAYMCEMQIPAMGVDLHCFDEEGTSVIGKRGEIVVKSPSPSFPLYLWKDIDNKILNQTYFSKFKGVWCQSDEGWINPKTKGLVVIGRSDDTLNQYGERFCAGDIYFAIEDMEELQDYICVGQERWDGDSRAVLFVQVKKGYTFSPRLKEKIVGTIKDEISEDFLPEVILETPGIPYNLNHKRMENLVKKIVATNSVPEVSNVKNKECLPYFCNIPELVSYGTR